MPELLTLNKKPGNIQWLSYGRISSGDMIKAPDSLKQIENEERIKYVMIDAQEQKSFPGLFDVYKAYTNLSRSMKYAFVGSNIDQNEDLHFLKTVTFNRGILLEIFAIIKKPLNGFF